MYCSWRLPPLPIVVVQSLSLTHTTIGRPATTCLFLPCNCSEPQRSVMLTFLCSLFSSLPSPSLSSLFLPDDDYLLPSVFVSLFFLTSPLSFLVICKSSVTFLMMNIYIFVSHSRSKIDNSDFFWQVESHRRVIFEFNNHFFFDISLSFHILSSFPFFKLTWVRLVLFSGDVVCKGSLCVHLCISSLYLDSVLFAVTNMQNIQCRAVFINNSSAS